MEKNIEKTFVKAISVNSTLKVKVSLSSLSNQLPYFSITGELREKGRLESCGCLHDEIKKHFLELEPLLQWHLTSIKEPMHYIANSLYWFGFTASEWKDADYMKIRVEAAKSTCVYDRLSGNKFILNDEYFAIIDTLEPETESYFLLKEKAEKFLNKRKPALMKKFDFDMSKFFGFTNYIRFASQFGESYYARIDTPVNKIAAGD